MRLDQMKLTTKLWLAMGTVVVLLASLIAATAYQTGVSREAFSAINESMLARVQAAHEWSQLDDVNAVRSYAVVASLDPGIANAFKFDISQTNKRIDELQEAISKQDLTQEGRKLFDQSIEARKVLGELSSQTVMLKVTQPDDLPLFIREKYLPALQALRTAHQSFTDQQNVSNRLARESFEEDARALILRSVLGMALLMAALLVGAGYLIRSIRQPLQVANKIAERIAGGDLSQSIDVSRGDEFGDLMKSLASMKTSLGNMVNQVRQSTDSIAIASAEIATGNNDLAQRTEETSSNLQSTASSMDNLTHTVQTSAENARQASTLAANASTVAERGGAVVRQVVSTMEDINISSRKIADIISVIDSIAFQTNILALNAAVEAARAGEQGRGFAVVASEVRSLAQRSAEAAKEIKLLINTSVDKVASGTQLVSDAGSTMNDIVLSVRKVADVIGEITAASGAQSTQISDINQAIGGLDQMTQQNAALVEQSAAAAESLRDQADQLARAVAVFKTDARALAMPQRPVRDITPRKPAVGYQRPHALARSPAKPALAGVSGTRKLAAPAKAAARKPTSTPPTLTKPVSAKSGTAFKGAAAPKGESDWESF